MIGDISIGTSFFGCISYCLEDKRDLTEEEKRRLSLKDGLQHKHRAEILAYNKCFGNKHELTDQLMDVARLSKRTEKPVLHLSLTLQPGEKLTRDQLIEAGHELVKAFKVDNNQYIIVEHKDTERQHIHVIANRVGYDGKAASTSNNYQKMQMLCRRLEKEYKLKEVLSSRRFLSKEQRLIPRHDSRKEKMKRDIEQVLKQVKHYDEFAKRMQALGYQIIKGRGITFVDDKKVRVKGSELGYSLMTIEKRLQQNQTQELKQKNISRTQKQSVEKSSPTQEVIAANNTLRRRIKERHQPTPAEQSPLEELQKGIGGIISDLINPEYSEKESINYELLKEAHKRKKRRKPKW